MKICLIISTLHAGGAERVISLMAEYWSGQGHQVALITHSRPETDFYALPARVERISLDTLRVSTGWRAALSGNLRLLSRLRRAVRTLAPDFVISFIDRTNVSALLATTGLDIPVIVSERADCRAHSPGRGWSRLRDLSYPRAAAVVVQTEELREWMAKRLPRARFTVIPNPVVLPPDPGARALPLRPAPYVLAMGRLVPQKGFDLLIRAFAQCAPGRPDWQLVILGEGPERERLEALTREYGLADRVRLPGTRSEPAGMLHRAALFVLSSRFEGFPNALLEAMACGVAVVSTDCPSGPAAIIRPGIDGLLVPVDDPAALASAMAALMDSGPLCERLGSAAQEVRERYRIDRVMGLWEALLSSVGVRSFQGRAQS